MSRVLRYLACLAYTPVARSLAFAARARSLPTSGPLVSVVVPIARHDRAHEIMRRSLAAQTYKSVETIFVDDSERRGAGWARNRGLDQARGKYVIFLDADDFFEPTFLATLVDRAERESLEMVMSLADRYEQNWRLYSPMPKLLKSPFTAPTVFVRLWRLDFLREKGLRFQEIPRSNDLYFSLAGTFAARRKALVRKVLVHYRSGQTDNLQSGNTKSPDCFFAALAALKECLPADVYAKVEREALAHNLRVNRGLTRLKIIRHSHTPHVSFRGLGPALGGGATYVKAKTTEWGVVATDENPDLIVLNHLRALVKWALNPFKPRVSAVFVVHGIHLRKYDFLPRTIANRIKRYARLTLERALYSRVDELVALNRDDVQMLKEVYHVKTPIRLEPNRVSARTPARKALTHFFLMVARFDFAKGHDVFLRAIAKAQEELRARGKRTLLIGAGARFEEMKALVRSLGIDDLVDFAGAIENAADKMTCAKVLVAPSRWEGSPYAVLEALAAGLSVIASDCSGNRELIKDGENGRLFPIEDASALARLLVDA